MYLLFFLVGFFGFVSMTALGFVHVGNAGGARGAGANAGHGFRIGGFHHSHAIGQTPGAHAQPSGGVHQAQSGSHPVRGTSTPIESRLSSILLALSPIDLFAVAMGAGAVGLLLHAGLAANTLALVALFSGLVFAFGIVRPLMGALSNFASRPSGGLEGMVAKSAVASTRFDAGGRGLITVQLDGQLRQVLARLEPDELSRGVQVGKGDPVTILEVDEARNVCRVTRELSS